MEKNMNNSVAFMAFSKGSESSEGTIAKHYVGVGSVHVLGVNPNKKEMYDWMGREVEEEPVYVGEQDNNGTKVPNVRLSFVVKTDPEKNNGIEYTTMYTLFLQKAYRFNRDETKVQVIDKYGRTAWVTKEECKNHEIPVYSNGKPANLDKDYRPCYVGEEALIKFLIAYLNIPNVMKYVKGEWITVDHPEDCEAGLEKIEDYFKGDFSELKEILKLQPNNKVKLAFGLRTTDEGKQYPNFFTEMPLKNGVSDYSKLDKEIKSRKEAGAYATTEFSTEDLHEYTVEATNLSGENPFPAPDAKAATNGWF